MTEPIADLTRRDVLRTCATSPLWLPLVSGFSTLEAAVQKTSTPRGLQPLNRWPRMVHEWFVKQVKNAEQKSLAHKNALKTKADAERYILDVRKRIRQSFGPFPEKTPLKPKVTRVVKRDGYHIENVIFESRPGFLVTGNLYVPRDRKFPLPGVVGTCGHSSNGKAATAYQSFAQGLARQGYVVLIFDPIGQGERLQYADQKLKSKIGVGVREHLHAGNQQFLIGEFLGNWRAWDGIRALDYLLTRKEVDPKRVGVTGNSGGGTMTTWLCGVEQRWSMAAPSCFVTTFRRNMENELPADTEQCPPRALALGLDHDDFIAALAPKPVILLAKEKDYFDVRGTREAYARLKRLYKLLGHEDNIKLFVGPTYHGYSKENREAMYRWFNKATRISSAETEPPLKLEKDKTLWCTPNGQVAELKSRTVFDFTRETASAQAKARKKPSLADLKKTLNASLKLTDYGPQAKALSQALSDHKGPEFLVGINEKGKWTDKTGRILTEKNLTATFDAMNAAQKKHGVVIYAHPAATFVQFTTLVALANRRGVNKFSTKLVELRGPTPRSRNIRHRGRSRNYPAKYHITYAVETQPGIHAIVTRLSDERLYSRPPRGKRRAILYVSHQSADDELRSEPLIRAMSRAEPGIPVFAVDLRGIGESRPGTAGADPYTNPYGADYFYAVHSLMLDRPYVGQRTHDLLRVLDWLRSVGHTDIHLVAKGWGALPATFAGILGSTVRQVTLKNALTSFQDLATTKFYDWPLSSFIPDVLRNFDLPDCYAALKKKNLRQVEPRGATEKS